MFPKDYYIMFILNQLTARRQITAKNSLNLIVSDLLTYSNSPLLDVSVHNSMSYGLHAIILAPVLLAFGATDPTQDGDSCRSQSVYIS